MRLRIASCLGAMVLLIAGLASCGGDGGTSGTQRVKVGVVLSLTGPAHALGASERDTVNAFQNSLGAADGARITWIVEDDGSDPTKAVVAVNRLVSKDRVDALICCSTARNTLAIGRTAESAEEPTISLSSGAVGFQPAETERWFFQTPYSDQLTLDAATDDMKGRFLSPVAFLAANDASSQIALRDFKELARAKGIRISGTATFSNSAKTVTAQLSELQRGHPDAYVIWGMPPAAAIAQRDVRKLRIDVPVYQSFGVANQAFLNLSGRAAEGVIIAGGQVIVAPALNGDNPLEKRITAFADRFRKKTGSAPSSFAGYAYDAMGIIRNAVKRTAGDGVHGKALRERLRDAIEKTHNLVGVTGTYSYSPEDHAGLDKRSVAMLEVIDGKFMPAVH